MKNKGFKVLSLTTILSTLLISGCGCGKEVNINFIGENSTTIRKIKSGSSLSKDNIPQPPKVKGKYCLWDRENFENITSDINVHYNCYDSVKNLLTNLPSNNITVEVNSKEASVEELFKNLVLTATLEDDTKKNVYQGEYIIDDSNYDKSIAKEQIIKIIYHNKSVNIKVNVKKKTNNVTAILDNTMGYINEGLPKIGYHSDVPGTIKFDDNQKLFTGTSDYTWTFIPDDLSVNDIVKGSSSVTIINAQSIVTNKSKEVFEFEYGTSKEDIIKEIENGLVVTGKFKMNSSNVLVNRTIDKAYYTITSNYEINQPGENIQFKINYGKEGSINYVGDVINVNVKKNDNYNISFSSMDALIIDESTTLLELQDYIQDKVNTSQIQGTLTLDKGQPVLDGKYSYKYTFTPKYAYYAIKKGSVEIKTKTVKGIVSEYSPTFAYNSKTKEEVKRYIKNNFVGYLTYSDDSISPTAIDALDIDIVIDDTYDQTKGNMYNYKIIYNPIKNISATYQFKVEKLSFVQNEDFDVVINKNGDPNKYPTITLTSKNEAFIPELYEIVTIKAEEVENGKKYKYYYHLIPSSEVDYKYSTIQIVIEVDYSL